MNQVRAQHPSTAGRAPTRFSEPMPHIGRGTLKEPQAHLRTRAAEDSLDAEYEDIGYNAREFTKNLEKQVARVKRMEDQDERLDTIVQVLGRLKEENDSR